MAELLDAAPDPLIGVRIHSLVVKRRLAEGGMGAIYLAQHERSPNIQKVIKFLLPEYARVPAIRKRFVREAEAAARLRHDNIIEIEDYGTLPDGQCYLVMDLLEGETLEEYLQRHPVLDVHRVFYILAPVCSALQHAHEHGIVHRDLKPGNIFLRRTTKAVFDVKLLDFGIAKDTRAADSIVTNTGMSLGTPAYMAAEQFEDAARVSPSADICSLAIIMWQMITGELPWGMHSGAVLYRKQLQERPPLPPESVMSPELAKVLYAALAVDPAARPSSMRAFAVATASVIPPIPPNVPSGAEILASVAADLVTDSPHHERTLKNVASQDRLGVLLWPRGEADARPALNVATSSGVPKAIPGMSPPTLPLRSKRTVAEGKPAAGPRSIPADHQPVPRRKLAVIGLTLVLGLLGGLATFAIVRVTNGAASVVEPGTATVDRPGSATVGASSAITRIDSSADAALPAAPTPSTTAGPIAVREPPADAALAAAAISDPPAVRAPAASLAPATPRPSRREAIVSRAAPLQKPKPLSAPVLAADPAVRASEAQTGVIVVRVRSWAEVWIDGRAQPTAPMRVTVPTGRHSVLLVNDDHRETVTITVTAKREAIIERMW